MTRPGLLLREAEVRPGVLCDVRVSGPVIAEIGPALAEPGHDRVRLTLIGVPACEAG